MSQLFGKYKGFIRRTDDPEERGRIICYCPQVMGEVDAPDRWLGWAEPCLPWMGGISSLDFGVPPAAKDTPSKKDEYVVWLEFEGGDIECPIWVGVTPIAPKPTGPVVRLNAATATARHGGSLIDSDPQLAPLATLGPAKDDHEVRLLAKEGKDLIIGSKNGGYLLLGPSGAHIVGAQMTINGRLINSKVGEG